PIELRVDIVRGPSLSSGRPPRLNPPRQVERDHQRVERAPLHQGQANDERREDAIGRGRVPTDRLHRGRGGPSLTERRAKSSETEAGAGCQGGDAATEPAAAGGG